MYYPSHLHQSVLLALGVMAGSILSAQPLAYDGFANYPEDYPGDGSIPDKNTPFVEFDAKNDGLMNVQSDSGLSFGRLPTEDGLLNMSSGGTEMTVRVDTSNDGSLGDFISSEGVIGKDGTTLYVSFLYQITNPAGQGFWEFQNTANGNSRFGLNHGWGPSTPLGFDGNKLHDQDGQIHFLVVKIDYQPGEDEVTVWLDPNLASLEGGATPAVTNLTTDASFDSFWFKGQGVESDAQLYLFDELRISSTWEAALGGVPLLPPAPVTQLTAIGASNESVALSWEDSSAVETGYVLERATSEGGPWTEVTTTDADVTSFLDTGLEAETTYFYRVFPTGANGDGDPSPVAEVTTLATGQDLPEPPQNADANLSEGAVSVQWDAASAEDEIFAYRVYRALDDGPFQLIAEINGDSEEFEDQKAPTNAELSYRIAAVNEFGESFNAPEFTVGQIPEPNSGPTWVWLEGENFDSSSGELPSTTWLEPSNGDEIAASSGGDLFGRIFSEEIPEGGFTLSYNFTAPSDGDFFLYVRHLWSYGPFVWRIDDGEWIKADTPQLAKLEETPYRRFFPLVWQQSEGTVPLTEGQEHTLEVRFDPDSDFPEVEGASRENVSLDVLLLSRVPFSPSGKTKPGVNLAFTEEGFWPFEPGQDTFTNEAVVDMSFLNEDVAGQDGWVQRISDDYYLGNGEKTRFTGVTVGSGNVSTYGAQGRFLAKRGFNTVRWHTNIFSTDPEAPSPAAVNEQKIAEAQQLVAAMKEEGIYTNLSFFFILSFRVREQWNIPGYDAAFLEENDSAPFGIFYWNDTFKDAYKSWVQELMTRPNPYVEGNTPLAEDTSIMNFEIMNEDNVFFFTFLPSNYPEEQRLILEEKFGQWAIDKFGSIENAYATWGEGSAFPRDSVENGRLEVRSPATLRARPDARGARNAGQLEFMIDLQKGFFEEITSFVRDLGYQGPISPTNWKTANDDILRDVEYYTYAETDVIDIHNYFNAISNKAQGFALAEGDSYANLSAVDRPGSISTAFEQVENRTSMVSEFIWVNPTDLSPESVLISQGYASLQDVDSLYWFAHSKVGYASVLDVWEPGRPSIMAQFPAANLLYRRGDIIEAPTSVREGRSFDSLLAMEETLIGQGSGFDPTRDEFYDPDTETGKLGMQSALVGKVEVAFGDSDVDFVHPELEDLWDEESGFIRSLTGEVELDQNAGIVTFDSARSQGATSYLGSAGPIELSDVTIDVRNEFGAVLVTALDDRPIAESEKVLIQVSTVDQPFGYETRPAVVDGMDGFEITNLGSPPFNMEKIDGEVYLQGFAGASAQYLNENGYPVASPVHMDDGEDLVVDLPFNAVYTVVTREVSETSAPYIYTAELPTAVKDHSYEDPIQGNSPAGDVTWTLLSGSLPDGMELEADGTVTGTPTEAGLFAFTVQAEDGESTTSAEVALRVLSEEEPTGIRLTVGEWLDEPDLGRIFGLSESIGFSENLGFLFTAVAPWLYQYEHGWMFLISSADGVRFFYNPSLGWMHHREEDGPWFRYFDGTDWLWLNFQGEDSDQ